MARGGVIILVYHSINAPSEDRIRIPNLVTPDHFAEQIEYLARAAQIIAFEDYLSCVQNGRPLPAHAVIITFDDGYRDNLTNACPVLRRHQLPATFFLATDYIGTGRKKWEDELSCVIRRSRAAALQIDLPPLPASLPLTTEADKRGVINQLVRALGRRDATDRQLVLALVQQQLGTTCDGDAMLNWDEVRQIAQMPGMSIGAHTASHPHLDRLSPHEVEAEIATSKQEIESQLRQPVTLFAYPYGTYDDHTARTLKTHDFAAAATLDYGRNSVTSDLFRLKRISAPDQGGVAFRVGLHLRGSAAGETLKRSYNLLHRLA